MGGHGLERPTVLLHHPRDLVRGAPCPDRGTRLPWPRRQPPTDRRPPAPVSAADDQADRSDRCLHHYRRDPDVALPLPDPPRRGSSSTSSVVLLVVLMINLSAWQFRRLHERRSLQRRRPDPHGRRRRSRSTPSCPRARRSTVPAPDEWRDGQRRPGTFDPVGAGAHPQPHVRRRPRLLRPHAAEAQPTAPPCSSCGAGCRWPRRTARTPDVPPPPTGTVTVDGRVRPTQNPGALASRDPATGVLTTMARVDIPRIQQQTSYPVAPAYVEMTASTPAPPAGSLPTFVPYPSSTTVPTSATRCSG